MAKIELVNVEKLYDDGFHAVKDFNLSIDEHEFLVLVGPSGCGKSTTLRMIAGLEDITSGELRIENKVANDIAPKDRNIAMVFQNYALYPHMTVEDNMGFSLKLKKVPKKERNERVLEAAKILDLEQYLKKKPKSLSGGQRQRVALGRAIVREASIFLMDEPLSNLDAKLRVQMRTEIIKLHQRLKTTTIYVTHDQTEAMTMATRIVIMKDGVIQQVGVPKQVYENPMNTFVGGFMGSPAMNFFEAELQGDTVKVGSTVLKLPQAKLQNIEHYNGKKVILGIRPENIGLVNQNEHTIEQNKLYVPIVISELTGAEQIVHSNIDGQIFIAKVNANHKLEQGKSILLNFNLEKAHLFDTETTERITVDNDIYYKTLIES